MNESNNHNDRGRAPMTFKAFKDYQFTKSLDREYKVMINPESFERDFAFHYNKDKTKRHAPTVGKFASTDAEKYNFTLIFDGTGIVDPNRCNVQQELDDFFAVLFTQTKKGYEPNFIELTYCGQIFHCTANSLKVSYTLFNTNGSPLRAKITCAFSSIGEKQHKHESNKDDNKTSSGKTTTCGCPPSNESYEEAYKKAEEEDMDAMIVIHVK